ncbi:MAG: YraN family protein [Bacteroidaceae bacterium]|nr:YraN family protein [Bacteroidaceae bacterium]
MATHNDLGKWGEEVAVRYLVDNGYRIVQRDWKSGHRDIDIIAIKGKVLVFVEVKTRRNRLYTEPEMAVDNRKMQNLRLAMNHYIKINRINQPCRFDVITVIGMPDGQAPEVNHIEDIQLF